MIKLKELHLENWRGWEKLDLVDLDNRGLCLISGANGSGKSSLRHALEYLLLDTTSDNLPIGELARDGKACKISCTLEKDGDIIEIERYRNHPKLTGKFLSVNGNRYPDDMSQGSIKDIQAEIEKLLDIDQHSLFVSTIFSQNSPSFPEVTEAERKRILYDALNLHKYADYHEKAKDIAEKLTDNIDDNERDIDIAENSMETINDELVDLKSKQLEWNANRQSRIGLVRGELADLQLSKHNSEQQITMLEATLQPIDEEKLVNLRSWYASLEKERNDLIVDLRTIAIELGQIRNKPNCPVLGKPCAELQSEQATVLKQLEPKRAALEEKYSEQSDKMEKLQEQISRINALEGKNHNIEWDIQRCKTEIETINAKVDARNTRLQELANEENPFEELIVDLDAKFVEHEANAIALKVINEKLRDRRQYFDYWVNGFSKAGIPNLKAEGFLADIEVRTNEILSTISDRLHVDIKAQAQLKSKEFREKVQYKVLSPDKKITDFKSYSGGQKQRIKVADIFAFNTLISRFNFIILDEVLELSLDEEGKDEVMSLIRQMSKNVGSIFVISHSKQIQDKFDQVIKVEMKNGKSYIA